MRSTLIRSTAQRMFFAALFALTAPVYAGSLSVSIEVPRLQVSEYHRPYVALWIARENHQVVADLSVWYDTALRNNEGEKWLKDMRQWWRRSGRNHTMPIDGVSGATRAPGVHQLVFKAGEAPLGNLEPGSYVLNIEAAREVGGRDLVQIPFEWSAESAERVYNASGDNELGNITLRVF